MAKKTIVEFVDDIDGSTDDVQTVCFTFDKHEYELDLGPVNRDALLNALYPFISVARYSEPEAPAKNGKRAKPSKASGGNVPAIRAWAMENGIPIGDRGRVSAEIREQYAAANG